MYEADRHLYASITPPPESEILMSAKVVHFEIPFDNENRAAASYRDVFDWQIQPMPEMSYLTITTGPVNDEGFAAEPGYIGGGMMQREAPTTHPVLVLDVDDIDAALTSVAEHGGSTAVEKMPIGDYGFATYFHDSEGQPDGTLADRLNCVRYIRHALRG